MSVFHLLVLRTNKIFGEKDTGVHLQVVGKEYGTTTGRRRRCGWLDLVVMKHSSLINGYDCLNLTKLDVLDGLAEVKIAVKYSVDGKELPGFPGPFKHLSLLLSLNRNNCTQRI
jgi:adenylosuccinate synthase